MSFELIAISVDATLLDSRKQIRRRTRASIDACLRKRYLLRRTPGASA